MGKRVRRGIIKAVIYKSLDPHISENARSAVGRVKENIEREDKVVRVELFAVAELYALAELYRIYRNVFFLVIAKRRVRKAGICRGIPYLELLLSGDPPQQHLARAARLH